MKKLLILSFCCILFTASFAENKQTVKSKPERVTVFRQGAQIYRSAKVNLKSGKNKVIFEGISPQINPQSLQVKCQGKFIMLDVKYNIKYPKPEPVKQVEIPAEIQKEMTDLEKQLVYLDFDLQTIKDRIQSLKKQKDILWKNNLMNNKGKSDSLPILKGAMDFFVEKADGIDLKIVEERKKEYELNLSKNKKTNRLNELRNYRQKNFPRKPTPPKIHQIIIDLSADYAVSGAVEISYLVNNAGWNPAYDIRAKDIKSKLNFTYKGLIYQNTGVEWKNVKLKVSTSNPNLNHNRPVMNPAYVSYYVPTPGRPSGYGYDWNNQRSVENLATVGTTNAKRPRKEKIQSNDMAEMPQVFQPATGIANVNQNATNVEFDVAKTHDIPSDGKAHTVLMKDYEIDAIYQYHAVPKLDKGAFLLAKVANWGILNLIAGNASLFLEDTYIGQSYINPATTADTLLLSLGRDEAITVKREKKECLTTSNFLKSKKTKHNTFEFTIRNNKNVAINIEVLDQIPLSKTEEIEVILVEAKEAEYNKDFGKITWDLTIEPGETKTFILTFEVKYPKNKQITGA